MVKSILFFTFSTVLLWSTETIAHAAFQEQCLQCHTTQHIPSEAIYRRYLMRYSSRETIKQKIFSYLKAPVIERSIMPPQFFKKFSIKEASSMSDEVLRRRIDDYIDYFDVSKRLFVPSGQN
ncbi:MAG TPA: hypothetical protein ENL02_02975 [Epsilonproteobacteria bacterium]|nr:hypothetical protein [Campylobacterota bacterium]